MKRKYYLRGLGFGILVTALVFVFVSPKEMTEAEIIKRAEELGYVKAEEEAVPNISLKDLMATGTPTPTPVPTIIVTPEPDLTEAPEETVVPEPTKTLEITETPTPEPEQIPEQILTPEPTLQPSAEVVIPEPTDIPETTVITAQISVERGDTASVVCAKIQEAGIVADGNELTNHIVWSGLADYIIVGTYTLSSDMTYDEIANILSGR